MTFRKLRIAWSVVCGIACVLLIVLWVRSYQNVDTLDWTTNKGELWVASCSGVCNFKRIDFERFGRFRGSYFVGHTGFTYEVRTPTMPDKTFRWNHAAGYFELQLPDWLLLLAFAGFIPAPFIRPRFSLRTLLITTTLAAVVLGLIVYSIKK
jgi:hypothetical protein